MSTKPELEKQVKELKQKIRDLESAEKKAEVELETLEDLAIGSYLDENNKFVQVEIRFNPETKAAQFVSEEVPQNNVTIAVRNAQMKLGKHITDLNRRR